MVISQAIPQPSIIRISLKVTFESPGPNELNGHLYIQAPALLTHSLVNATQVFLK